MRTRWRAVAHVDRTHGNKGEVVVSALGSLPFLLREGMVVAIVPPGLRDLRERQVLRCKESGGRGHLLALEGTNDIGAARDIVGKTLLVRRDDLPRGCELCLGAWHIGREVVDERLGSLGTIEEVLSGGVQDVWVVRDARGEVLVPAVAEIVVSVPETGAIRTRVPRGLVPWDEGA